MNDKLIEELIEVLVKRGRDRDDATEEVFEYIEMLQANGVSFAEDLADRLFSQ